MWIVADDASTPTKQVMQLLHRLNVTHKYLLGKIDLYYTLMTLRCKQIHEH